MIQENFKDFKFLGNKTDMEQMIGNAVPVNLARYVGECIMAYLGIEKPVNYEELKRTIRRKLLIIQAYQLTQR